MNKFFIKTTKKLNVTPFKNPFDTDINQITSVFQNHVSIRKIQECFPNIKANDFNFRQVSLKEVKSEILNLNIKKTSTKGSIPATLLKQCVDIYLPFLTNATNKTFLDNYFPEELKKAEIIPVYKKEDPLKKENYRPVSLLPHVSKIFEKLIYKQINDYICDKLSKYIMGFRKCHGTQHSLLVVLEKWKKVLDKGEDVCTIFMDLSKAFDSINHDLLFIS